MHDLMRMHDLVREVPSFTPLPRSLYLSPSFNPLPRCLYTYLTVRYIGGYAYMTVCCIGGYICMQRCDFLDVYAYTNQAEIRRPLGNT